MTELDIRLVVPEDLDALYDVMEVVAAEGKWIGTELPFDREARRAHALEALEDGTMIFLVAEMKGKAVGHLGLEQVIPGLYELGMMVLPDFREQKIGSALLERAIDLAWELDAYKLTLQVWPHNEPALALYERFGFEREGYLVKHWRRQNGELWDAVIMGLVLSDSSLGSD